MDSPGQMGAPFSEGKWGLCLWSQVEADPPIAASIPAASTLQGPRFSETWGLFLFSQRGPGHPQASRGFLLPLKPPAQAGRAGRVLDHLGQTHTTSRVADLLGVSTKPGAGPLVEAHAVGREAGPRLPGSHTNCSVGVSTMFVSPCRSTKDLKRSETTMSPCRPRGRKMSSPPYVPGSRTKPLMASTPVERHSMHVGGLETRTRLSTTSTAPRPKQGQTT